MFNKNLIVNIKSVLFPCLLSFVALISIFNIYEKLSPLSLIAIFIPNAILFLVYEKLRIRNKTWFSCIIIFIILILALYIAARLVRSQGWNSYMSLMDWFFKTGDVDFEFPMFSAALLTLFIPFSSSTIFYFTNVRYNPFFLMLTNMTTFALYAKTFTEIPFIFPSMIIALFLLVSIERKWYRFMAEKALSYRKFVIIGVCFVALSAYIAGLFPPAETTPYREKFDELISGQSFNLPLNLTSVIDAPWSGGNNRTSDDDKVLFIVHADEPFYLRRQVFDEWRGDAWIHYDDKRPESQKTDWFTEGHTCCQPTADVQRKQATVVVETAQEFYFLPMPPHVYNVDYDNSTHSEERVVVSIRDEFMTEKESISRPNAIYTVDYYDYSSYVNTPEIMARCTFPYEFDGYLETTLSLPDYPKRTQVRELALEITRGISNDYDKAKAIEQYFYNGEFEYDLGFNPRSKAVDYFLFNSKTGTCSDFATAMTILAREAGIPARYVEGYMMNELFVPDDGSAPGGDGQPNSAIYQVKVKHGHAFPEVFIEGRGWIIFEPTIPASNRLGYSGILAILISIGVLGVLTVVFLIYILPLLKERRFVYRALNSSREKQVEMFYNKIYGEFMKKLRLEGRTLSSRDLNGLADSHYGIGIGVLTESYDGVVYGGVPAGDGDFFGVYSRFFGEVKISEKKRRLFRKRGK